RALLLIDDDVVNGAVVLVLLADLDHETRKLVIEDSFPDVEGRPREDDITLEVVELQRGDREDIVIEKEGDNGQQQADEEERPHETEKGNARGFYGDQLEGLAQVAQGHDRRKQDCQ